MKFRLLPRFLGAAMQPSGNVNWRLLLSIRRSGWRGGKRTDYTATPRLVSYSSCDHLSAFHQPSGQLLLCEAMTVRERVRAGIDADEAGEARLAEVAGRLAGGREWLCV